ncbi:MAG: glycosyltransferase [Nitrososphaerota archaeon]
MEQGSRNKGLIVISYSNLLVPLTATDVIYYHKVEALLKLGWTRTLILQGDKQSSSGSSKDYIIHLNSKVVTLNDGINGRFFRHFLFLLMCFVKVINIRKEYGIIYFVGAEFLPIALFAKTVLGYTVVGDVDTYTIAYNRGEIDSSGAYDLVERLFEPFMNSCDVVVVINERDRDALVRRGFNPEKILIMPPSRTIPEFDETYRKKLRADFIAQLQDKGFPYSGDVIIITFHGSGKSLHNRKTIDNIVYKVVPEVLRYDKRFLFLIIGGGYVLDKQTQQKYGKHIYITGFLEEQRMQELLLISDIYIAPMTFRAKGGTKTKVIEAAAYGLPVIIPPELGEQYFKKGCPFIISNIDGFPNVIRTLALNEETRSKIGHETYDYVKEYYSDRNYDLFAKEIIRIVNGSKFR